MTIVNFEVLTYEIKLARELTASADGVALKFRAIIGCHGADYRAIVYVLDDTSPVPNNSFLPSAMAGTIFVPTWQYEWFVDLLRNEKPVYCYLNSDFPNWNYISTSLEPVGEQEASKLAEPARTKGQYDW